MADSIATARMMEVKQKINRMLDDLSSAIPSSNPLEFTIALVAVAGAAIKELPSPVKERIFGAAIAILGQEAGFRTIAAPIGDDEIGLMSKNLKGLNS